MLRWMVEAGGGVLADRPDVLHTFQLCKLSMRDCVGRDSRKPEFVSARVCCRLGDDVCCRAQHIFGQENEPRSRGVLRRSSPFLLILIHGID